MRNWAHVRMLQLLWSLLSRESKNEPASLLSVKLGGPDAEGVDTAQAVLPVQGDVIPLGLTPVRLCFLCQLLGICSCLASTLMGFHQPYLTLGYTYSCRRTILITFQLPIKSKIVRIKGASAAGAEGATTPGSTLGRGPFSATSWLVRLWEQIWLSGEVTVPEALSGELMRESTDQTQIVQHGARE